MARKQEINLLPAKGATSRGSRIASAFIVAAVGMAALIAVGIIIPNRMLGERSQRYGQLQKEIEQYSSAQVELDAIIQETMVLNGQRDALNGFRDLPLRLDKILTLLEGSSPAGVRLTTLQNAYDKLTIAGRANNDDEIMEFYANLRRSGVFSEVFIAQIRDDIIAPASPTDVEQRFRSFSMTLLYPSTLQTGADSQKEGTDE